MGKTLAFFHDRFIRPDEPVLPVEERGLNFGDGVYEMFRVYYGRPYTLKEHLARLVQSADSISLELPKSLQEIASLIQEGIDRMQMEEGTVYLQVTRGSAPRMHVFPEGVRANLAIIWKEGAPGLEKERAEGVKVCTFPDERWKNCYIKSLNLLPNVLAKEKAKQKGMYEAIFVRDGEVKEGASCNIFLVKDGVFKTTLADQSILNGITRQKVIQLLQNRQIPVYETRLTMEDVETAEEVMLTSSIQEVLPVVRVDDLTIGSGTPGTYFRSLLQWYEEDVRRECTAPVEKP